MRGNYIVLSIRPREDSAETFYDYLSAWPFYGAYSEPTNPASKKRATRATYSLGIFA